MFERFFQRTPLANSPIAAIHRAAFSVLSDPLLAAESTVIRISLLMTLLSLIDELGRVYENVLYLLIVKIGAFYD